MIDISGNQFYEYIEKDLSQLRNQDLESLLEEAYKRSSGHPTGSTAEAQSRSVIYRVERELSKRDSEKTNKSTSEDLQLSRSSFGLNKLILFFTVVSVVLSIVSIVISLIKH